jgi:hypothetical protein
MQSLFYLAEEGDAHYRSGKWNLALKKYYAIQKVSWVTFIPRCADASRMQVFDEIEDDQYDFHGYSLRKFTAGIYVE